MREWVPGIYIVKELFKSFASERVEMLVSWALPGPAEDAFVAPESGCLICAVAVSLSTKGGWLFLYLPQATKFSC